MVFADGTQSIYLADLSGDGLTDLVRIRNGEVCYWPNLGYGRFGAKVTMDDAPLFDYSDQFNQQRIRLADIDGSGTTDIIYLGGSGVHIYFNQSGNSWSKGRTLTQFPRVDNLSSVMVADLKGNGTACLIWSSPLPGNARQQMRYIDLMGGQKPHLLVGVKNNLGAETRVHYAASTKFYLDDQKAGKPWITRISFPVHVVERVETYDHISRNRFATHYTYHHGYFDGIEREFRGFGMVEQLDTEEIGTDSSEISEGEDTNWEEASFVPPVLTRTWFHTGAYFEENLISKQFEDEYYREGDPSLGKGELDPEQFSAMLLDDTVLPEDLIAEETREACRALKGGILRQEVYALDRQPDGRVTEESDRPYTVSEGNYTIKQLQPRGDNKHAVFFVYPLETIDFHYERKLVDVGGNKLDDPRVSHQITLKVDDFGNVERSVAIGYPRRDIPGRKPEQEETHITFTVNSFINSPELHIKFPQLYSPEYLDWYRVGLPAETQTYEIVKPPEPAVTDTSVALFKIEDIRTLIKGLFGLDRDEPDPSKTLPYEKWNWRKAPPGETKLRLIEHVRTLYRKDDLTGFLPLGQLDSLALPYESYKLALTLGLVTHVFDGKVSDAIITNEGRYVHTEGDSNWWIPSGQVFYSLKKNDSPLQELAFAQQHFFLPHRFQDPFDQVTTISYDNYDMLMLESKDPLHNKVTAGERDEQGIITNKNDYRVLQPTLITDPNGVVSEALFDGLGMVVATAIHKGNIGDSLQGVQADLTPQQIDDFFTDPGGQAVTRLGPATTRIIYDVDRYYLTGNPDRPPYAATIARETHVSDPVPADGLKVQVSFSYSDGFGREIQTKIQAEPGTVVDGGPIVNPRWVGTGWTIFNNKGKPVRQYEPFFDDTYDFRYGKEVGVSPILFYDPVERVVATLHPNNTYEKVVFDPWHQKSYDVNDTVKGDPRTDPDISGYVGKYFTSQPGNWKTWLQQRDVDPLAPPQDSPGLDHEKKATVCTLVHADTPTIAFFDSLGRTFLTVAHNRFERRTNGDTVIVEEKYNTRVVFDIEGNQREVIDAKDRIVMLYDYDMLGSPIHQASMEAGERWMLNDVTGKPIRAWDSRGHNFWTEYDELRRPLRQFVRGTNDKNSDPRTFNTDVLFEKIEYGEDQANDIKLNLRTRIFRQYDGAGIVTNMDRNTVINEDEAYDFKGNLLRSKRDLVDDHKNIINWSNSIQTDETFSSSTTYDALNRPIQIVAPHSSKVGTKLNVIQPVYNEANLLEREDVWLEQDTEPEKLLDPGTAAPTHQAVKNIDYNAKGQRVLIQYGNGAETRYRYDPDTFRLIHLYTRRGAAFTEDCGDEPPPPRFPVPEKPPRGKPCGLQNIHYTYDPVGNIIVIRDDAQQTIYFNGEVVRPDADYTYDAIYRLIKAHGREHIGQVSVPQTTWNDVGRIGLAHPHDGQKMRNYSEIYDYDEVGNFLKLNHYANSGDWVRTYDYNGENEESLIETGKSSNRLSSTTVRGATSRYTYDEHGNMTRMPHFAKYDVPDQYNMYWDFEDQLQMVDKGGGCIAYYVYDAAGQRVRKVVEQDGVKQKERIYLGGFEVYREYNGNRTITIERETLHIMDDKQRIALVETRTQGDDPTPRQLIRYQFGNHLGSASLELDAGAHVISYEEYYPYGSTSYQAVRKDIEVPLKRYRYSGKERDEETGLYYYGARYYASWFAKWVSSDPAGNVDGPNTYVYALDNPIKFVDSSGMQAGPPPEVKYAPLLSNTGASSAQWYANLVYEGEKQGGVTGAAKIVGGWSGGLLASLWTPDTAMTTGIILSTAGVGVLAGAGALGSASIPIANTTALAGAYETGVSTTEAITGKTSGAHIPNLVAAPFTGIPDVGRELTPLERGVTAVTAAVGIISMGATYTSQLKQPHLYKTPTEYAHQRSVELQNALPKVNPETGKSGSYGRITMSSSVNERAYGYRNLSVAASGKGANIRAPVKAILKPTEKIVIGPKGGAHAEIKNVYQAKPSIQRPVAVGAGRKICIPCETAIVKAGAKPASPTRSGTHIK